MIAAAVLFALLAQPAPSPLPVRLQIEASEELEPDLLRSLAVPGVVLWVRTRSNTLRASTLETLRRAQSAFVQLRPPLTKAQAQQLEKAPRVGLWLQVPPWSDEGLFRAGPRPLAVELQGELDESLLQKIAAARPAWLRWRPKAGELNVLSFARFSALPGIKVLRAGALASGDAGCGRDAFPRVTLESEPLAAGEVPPPACGSHWRLRVHPAISFEALLALAAAQATSEWVVDVGASAEAAARVGRLLSRLEQTEKDRRVP